MRPCQLTRSRNIRLAKRRRIALWPFRQLQSYIDYKARWAGVPVEYVSPSYTSKKCNVCGSINRKLKLTDRSWLCPHVVPCSTATSTLR